MLFLSRTTLGFRRDDPNCDARMDLSLSLEALPPRRSLWAGVCGDQTPADTDSCPGLHSPATPEYQLPQRLGPMSALSLRLRGRDIQESLQPCAHLHFLSDDTRTEGGNTETLVHWEHVVSE